MREMVVTVSEGEETMVWGEEDVLAEGTAMAAACQGLVASLAEVAQVDATSLDTASQHPVRMFPV